MDRDQVLQKVRTLRVNGAPPKVIARAVGLSPAQVAPLIRTVAAEVEAAAPERAMLGCWVTPGWSNGLTVNGHPEWRDADQPDSTTFGLAGVVVAREDRRGRASACGYLVDTYCLGVKNAAGPKVIDPHALPEFVAKFLSAFGGVPIPASLELARHLVFGAVDYARELGFEPHPDFAPVAAHLGTWTGPSAISFGREGRPTFVQGPYDDVRKVVKTLERTVGTGNFQFLMGA